MQRTNIAPNTLEIQPSIPVEYELEMSGSELSDELSTAQPNNLFNNPTHDSSNNDFHNQASDDDSYYLAVQSQLSNATTDFFAAKYGPW